MNHISRSLFLRRYLSGCVEFCNTCSTPGSCDEDGCQTGFYMDVYQDRVTCKRKSYIILCTTLSGSLCWFTSYITQTTPELYVFLPINRTDTIIENVYATCMTYKCNP